MKVNFEIEESIALRFEDKYLDIHNCYEFIGFHYDNRNRHLVLTFSKSNGNWVKSEDPPMLTLAHHDVTYLDIKYENNDYHFPPDDLTLSDITFFPSDVRQTNDSIMLHKKPKDDDDIIYIFQSDYYIRINCRTIILSAEM